MGRSSLEWLCFFIAVVRRGSSLLRTCTFRTHDILASVYDRFTKGFCHCGHVCRCSLYVIALVVELSARSCKSERVQTSGEMRALAKSRCRQVRHGAWRSGEA